MLGQLGRAEDRPALAAGLAFLRREQESDGSWFGRWGMNYVYGTWSVLCALSAAGVSHRSPEVRRAVDWLVSVQNSVMEAGVRAVTAMSSSAAATSAQRAPHRRRRGRCSG